MIVGLRMQTGHRRAVGKMRTGRPARTGYRRPWLVFSAAALAALLLYLPTVKYGFVWDDGVLIQNNPSLARTSPIEFFTRGFWDNPDVEHSAAYMSYYRPVTSLSLHIDRRLWGLQPSGYHLTNVIINAAVVFLVCLLLWELFGSVWLAGLGGLLVGIHPAMNCVVTFVSNRTYLLALLFLLVSAYALGRGQHGRGRTWPVLFGVSLLLSALALEAALVFAAIAAGWLLVDRARYHKLRAWLAAAISPAAIYFLLRLAVARVPFTGSDAVMQQGISQPLRLLNTFGQQLQLLLFPFNQKVIYVPGAPFIRLSVYTVLGLMFLGLPLYALFRIRRSASGRRNAVKAGSDSRPGSLKRAETESDRLGWYGYAWMVLFLLPFAQLVFLGPAGRMLYLAAPGVLILSAALYRTASRRQRTNRIVFCVVLLYTAACAVQTLRRNPIWENKLSLSQTMVREAPASAGGQASYGLELSRAGRTAEAVEHLSIAVRLDPNSAEAHIGLAFALIDQGDLSAAIPELREVVRLRPNTPGPRNDLAVTLMRLGQFDAAIAEYREALRLDPNSELALNNMGYAYLQTGNLPEAISALKAALRLKPDFPGARRNLADAYRAAGLPDSAALVEGSK